MRYTGGRERLWQSRCPAISAIAFFVRDARAVFEDMRLALPFWGEALIWVGRSSEVLWYLLPLFPLAMTVLAYRLISCPVRYDPFEAALLYGSPFGGLFRRALLSRPCRLLGKLLGGGMNPAEAVEVVRDLYPTGISARAMDSAARRL